MATQNKDDLIPKALDLLKDADDVELKVTVPDTDRSSAIAALGMDVLDAELRQVVFFDTPDLKLHRHGLVLRARRTQRGGDTVIKLRPVMPADVPGDLRQSPSFSLEIDAMPGTVMCSGSLRGRTNNADVNLVLRSKLPIRKLFSKPQRLLFKKHAPKGLTMDSLTPLGPINVAKLKFQPAGFKRLMMAEAWFYPDSSRILELSTKCAPNQAFQVLAELKAFLTKRGISLSGKQETKTRKTLEYFSSYIKHERRNAKLKAA
jgi:hypothetical protein